MIYTLLAKWFYLPRMRKLDREIGCHLEFKYIPKDFIQSIMTCEMTKTWKNFGLNVIKGKNHFTIGKIENGVSTRFKKDSIAYQSWLGAYTVKLDSEKMFTPQDHFKLAIADQNNWLRWYGDEHPFTTTEGFRPSATEEIVLNGFKGTMFEFGCQTHSDVGATRLSRQLVYASDGEAALYSLGNPKLHLKPKNFVPNLTDKPYEVIDLWGYIAIFDIKPNVKVVLYANGTTETFPRLKEELLAFLKGCEIKHVS